MGEYKQGFYQGIRLKALEIEALKAKVQAQEEEIEQLKETLIVIQTLTKE